MVGETRDAETAAIAIQAAMTGHLVFSTLHTNDAVSAVTRLVDLQVEPYMIAATSKVCWPSGWYGVSAPSAANATGPIPPRRHFSPTNPSATGSGTRHRVFPMSRNRLSRPDRYLRTARSHGRGDARFTPQRIWCTPPTPTSRGWRV